MSALLAAFSGYLAASFFVTTDFEPLYILMALSAVVLEVGNREGRLADSLLTFRLPEIRTVFAMSVAGIVVMYVVTAALSHG